MIKALVTGASGFIGHHVTMLLLEKGFSVRALCREGAHVREIEKQGAEIVRGDVTDRDSVREALRGCEAVFHLAADYRLWVPDPERMYHTNVQGTRNVLDLALRSGSVGKVVYTSTVGALAPAKSDGTPSDELSPVRMEDMTGHYKKSKFMAEREAERYLKAGLQVVTVNPTTPVGEMDRKPTPTGRIIVDFLNGRMPAYLDSGLNFVDVRDVAAGHWLAFVKGSPGEKYILGNRNMSLKEFLGTLASVTGKRPPALKLPYLPVLLAAYVNEAASRVTGRPPAIPLTGVRMAGKLMFYNCGKAVKELGLPQSPVEDALGRAARWFVDNGYVKKSSIRKWDEISTRPL